MSTPPAKRQKVSSTTDVFTNSAPVDPSHILTIRDLSFQTPLRKKLNLIFTQNDLQAHSPAKQELSIPLNQIRHVISVTAPDKTAKTWNFVVMYGDNTELEAWVFGVPDTVAKTATGGDTFPLDTTLSYKALLISAFKKLSGVVVAEPSSSEFESPIALPGRPKETAFHAVAHRGAKEGYLYFLSTGILYGFKKPVSFFPLATIREVTFASILQRTFNLVVSTEDNVDGEEFGMIDQMLFNGIQGYTVKHGIQDASLSEQRKAKKLGKKEENEDSGELERAVKEYEAEHDEDDDFRDFDKAEADWEDDEPKAKGKGKGKIDGKSVASKKAPVTIQDIVNGDAGDSSDDEELDATFESGDSDGGSHSGSTDEDGDDDSDSDDDDDDSEDEDEDEDEQGDGEDEEDEDEED
jgi:hypothetical protein